MRIFSSRWSIIVVIFLLMCMPAWADTLWCPKIGGIGGRESEMAVADRYIGQATTSATGLGAYMTADKKGLYFHTNYRPSGAEGTISLNTTDKIFSAETWIAYILDPRHNTDSSESVSDDPDFDSTYSKSIKLYVDQKLFSDPVYGHLDFGQAENVYIIGTDGISRPSIPLPLDDTDDSVDRIVQLDSDNANLYASVRRPDLIEDYSRMRQQPFHRDAVKVISLVASDTFNKRLASAIPSEYISKRWSSLDEIRKAFEENNGKTVFLIGHIPFGSGDFETNGATFSIQAIEDIAKINDVRPIFFGCDSKKYSESTGVINEEIQTNDILRSITSALSATTNGEFWSKLVSPELKLVVTHVSVSFTGKAIVTMGIYRSSNHSSYDHASFIPVGTMIVYTTSSFAYWRIVLRIFSGIFFALVLAFAVKYRKVVWKYIRPFLTFLIRPNTIAYLLGIALGIVMIGFREGWW